MSRLLNATSSVTNPLAHGAAPAWASRWGEDAVGVWAAFSVGDVAQRMRWVEPGRFIMGSPVGELGRWSDHEEQHEVVLTCGYWLGETPVTQDLWRAVMHTRPSRFHGDRRPVEMVSWDGAVAFCKNANRQVPGLALSLPTEAEWEHACRAGTSTTTWNGDLTIMRRVSRLDHIAWFSENSGGMTQVVGVKPANPWGFYDMLGNVWEWCADAWTTVKHNTVDPLGRGERNAQRVYRGGSMSNVARNVRAASRNAYPPTYSRENLGFRVAIGLVSRLGDTPHR